ncbi:phage tail length tape measure family protein [Bradyrhizobium sp.]|uniref:phage tail length tape measure family protein n=1 Tax=Bradyrhizobium sp. TaxID=376 RepID=UPI0039E70B96
MAGVALSSLRVTVDGDAGGYSRMAAAKVDADVKMIAGDRARAAALAQADAALGKAIPGVAQLSRSLLDGYGAGATFEAQIRKIGNAVDRGLGLDRAEVLLDATYRKFGLVADAAALAERGFVSIAPAVDAVNARMAAAAENAQRLQGQIRAQNFQQGINAQFGIGGPDTSAARGADVAAYGQALDDLRAKYNPLFDLSRKYETELEGINAAAKVGAISSIEQATAIDTLNQRYTDIQSAAGKTADAHAALSTQAMAAQHAVRSMVEQIAMGVPPSQVLLQQINHLSYAATGPGGLKGAFQEAASFFTGFATVGNAAFLGVAASVGVLTAALQSYLNKQDAVKIGLSGAGRASGASVSGINSIAESGASTFGLSISGARELATALASTGKIANDNLLPIVQIGKDFATTFGISDADAVRQLAGAFADPVRGADQLNDRLGFLDAGMQRQIASLTAQNRLYDAQRVLLDGVRGSLAKTSEVTSVWSQAWTAAKNAASGFYDYVGEKLANAGGLNASLEQQRDNLKRLIADYNNPFSPGSIGGGSDLETLKRQLSDINALIEKRAQATQNVAAAQASLRVSQTIMTQLPEIGARQALQDAASIGGAAAEDPILMKALGLTQQQVDRAKAILNQLRDDFRTTFQEIKANSAISYDAVTAFSPSAKAAIAQRQAIEQYRTAGGLDPSEKARIGQDAYNLSIHQTVTALQEAARARALSANQAVQSAQLEIDLVGKSIGQQAEMRANLQARQQLQQQASQYRTEFDEAEYARLQKINAELGRRTDLAARAQIRQDIKFGSQTALLSPDDVQIAQQLKGIYPDVATALNSVEAAGLRANAALSQASSTISSSLTTGIADAIDGTKAFGTAMADTGKAVIRALEEMIIKLYIIGPLMRSLQSGFSLFGGSSLGTTLQYGGLPGEASSSLFGPLAPSARGNVFGGGNIIPFARGGVVSRPSLFPMANGGTGLMGEAGPEAVMPLRRGADGRLGVSMVGGKGGSASGFSYGGTAVSFGDIHIQVPDGTSATDASTIARTVKESMTQVVDERILYHTRQRGYLNNGT